jgi:hypothetical protein
MNDDVGFFTLFQGVKKGGKPQEREIIHERKIVSIWAGLVIEGVESDVGVGLETISFGIRLGGGGPHPIHQRPATSLFSSAGAYPCPFLIALSLPSTTFLSRYLYSISPLACTSVLCAILLFSFYFGSVAE